MEGGGWRVEGGMWRVEGGGWRVEGGGWRVGGGGEVAATELSLVTGCRGECPVRQTATVLLEGDAPCYCYPGTSRSYVSCDPVLDREDACCK